jgi:hypothetical protein
MYIGTLQAAGIVSGDIDRLTVCMKTMKIEGVAIAGMFCKLQPLLQKVLEVYATSEYICEKVCIYIYVLTCIHVYMNVYLCLHKSMYVFMYTYMCVFMYLYMYVFMYIFLYPCRCVDVTSTPYGLPRRALPPFCRP